MTVPAIAVSGPASAEEYRLGVMDKIRVRVAEWRTAEGEVRDWSAISGDYTVGASGAISLPFVGEVPVSGKTTAEISEEVGSKMQALFGMRDRPSASVELAQYRPIYISGEVETPGEYPYAPNLTVLKALSLGGGLRRADSGQRFARDFLRSQGESEVLISERNRLLVRRARLQAELAEKKEIEMPAELKNVPGAATLLESELALLQSRDKRMELQLTALADLKSLLQSEIVSLAKNSETQTRQLTIVDEDRKKVDALAEKGLAISSRRLALEQRSADLQTTLLNIDTNSLRAKQDINRAIQDETTLRNDRDAQLYEQLQATEQQLDQIALQLGTSRDLMAEALLQSGQAAALKDSSLANVRYSIVREKDGATKEMPADENTKVLPGDVIKVNVSLAVTQ
ncbi:MAG: polysaccharide biosynthesis/export family protein [Shinella sp.]|nr:polysaccharide biosynthesis/export family protein [Shinella sp.]